MDMPIFGISTQHCGTPHTEIPHEGVIEPGWKIHAVLSAGEGIPHEGLAILLVDQNSEAVAAAHVFSMVAVGRAALGHGEAGGSDTVRRVHDGSKAVGIPFKEAEQRRLSVVLAEAFEELGVGEDAKPALAHDRCAGERGRIGREADEDLSEEIVVAEHLAHGTPLLPTVHMRRAGNGVGPKTKIKC